MNAKYEVISLDSYPDDVMALEIAEKAAQAIAAAGLEVTGIRGVHAFDVEFSRDLRLASVIFRDKAGELSQVDLHFAGDAPESAVTLLVEKALRHDT